MPTLPRSASIATCILLCAASVHAQNVTRYVRYEQAGVTHYGELAGDSVYELQGDLFGAHERTGKTYGLSAVRLLAPVEPSKVIAVGLNYRSHLGDREPAAYPGLFAKYPTSIIGPDAPIVRPTGSKNLHYEGELVLVIGKTASNVPVERAHEYVFGVTAGNDVSERDWQRDDLQWFRAKASDTFAPLGPVIARGLNYNDLLLQTRVNDEVRQSERTRDLIFDVATIVSYVSRYVTLMPGDVIFTGTPQTTRAMEPGDVIEIEIEGVGVLRNPVVAAQERASVFERLNGEWCGEGTLMGRSATFTMNWRTEHGFAVLSFSNAFAADNGQITPVLQSVAVYRTSESNPEAVWLDSRGVRVDIRWEASDSTLTANWAAPTERGRTLYRVIAADTIDVTDEVQSDDSLRTFATSRYARGACRAR